MKSFWVIPILIYGILLPQQSFCKPNSIPKDSSKWINKFRSFRTALYQHNISAVKKYFHFPVINSNNEIWYLVLTEKEMASKKFAGEKPVPFTEKDFLKYYDKVFSKAFIKCFLKIKTTELDKKGYTETSPIHAGNSAYQLFATYERDQKLLSLNLAYTEKIKSENGSVEDTIESNVIYYFTIKENGELIFKEIRLAG